MKKFFAPFLAVLISFGINASAQESDREGLAIATAADAFDAGWGSSRATGSLILIDANGARKSRTFTLRAIEAGAGQGGKSLFRFEGPANIAGVGLLNYTNTTRADDQWLFLPSDRRTTKIASGDQTGSFVGTEFTFEDMSSIELDKYTYQFGGKEACPNADTARECFVVTRFPVEADSGYSKQVYWTDTEAFRTYRVDLYDRSGTLAKVLQSVQFLKYGTQYWRPSAVRMSNLLNGRSSIIQFDGYVFGQDGDPALYTQASLEAGL